MCATRYISIAILNLSSICHATGTAPKTAWQLLHVLLSLKYRDIIM